MNEKKIGNQLMDEDVLSEDDDDQPENNSVQVKSAQFIDTAHCHEQ